MKPEQQTSANKFKEWIAFGIYSKLKLIGLLEGSIAPSRWSLAIVHFSINKSTTIFTTSFHLFAMSGAVRFACFWFAFQSNYMRRPSTFSKEVHNRCIMERPIHCVLWRPSAFRRHCRKIRLKTYKKVSRIIPWCHHLYTIVGRNIFVYIYCTYIQIHIYIYT